MARKNSPTILQEELYPPPGDHAREEIDDARMLDLEAEQESPFLRGQKRVSVRRNPLPKKTTKRLLWGAGIAAVVITCAVVSFALYRSSQSYWRFTIQSSDDIEIAGLSNVTQREILSVIGDDIGRNIFFVPLAEQKAKLEQIPWVESASIMRFVPNRLRIEIRERTPVAFARIGSKISLIDAGGALMDLPSNSKAKYSFPVILGATSSEPLSTRSARMKIYNDLVSQLDSGGAHYSQDISEVDLSDPDDVKVLTGDPQGAVLVHLGSSNFLDRYKLYVAHVQGWRQQFNQLDSVDLRYERQIVVNPEVRSTVKSAPLSLAAAKAAMSAGVKQAALVTREMPKAKIPGPPPIKIATVTPKPAAVKPAVAKSPAKPAVAKVTAPKTPVKKWVAPKKKTASKWHPKPAAKKVVAKSKPATVQSAAQKTKLPAAKPATQPVSKKPSPGIAKGQEQP